MLLLVACSFIFDVEAKKEIITARKGDIPFIKCSVCEAIAKQLARQVKEKREQAAPKKVLYWFFSLRFHLHCFSNWGFWGFLLQLTEFEIIDVAENICNMKKEESDWILKLDIVESGDKLQVKLSTKP